MCDILPKLPPQICTCKMGSLDANDGTSSRESTSDTSIASYAIYANAASHLVSPKRLDSSTALEPNLLRPSTSYVLTRSEHLENNVDSWIQNSVEYDEPRRPRRDPAVNFEQERLADHRGSLQSLLYMLTLLPLINLQRQGWCGTRNSIMIVLNAVDCFALWLKQVVAYVRTRMSQMEIDQILHDCFVVVVDIILALHALVFLVISFYEGYEMPV